MGEARNQIPTHKIQARIEDITGLLGTGSSCEEIAKRLDVSPRTLDRFLERWAQTDLYGRWLSKREWRY